MGRAFSSPEPVVSWSRGLLQIKPSGSGDENVRKATCWLHEAAF